MASHELGKIARNLDRKLNELQKSVIEIRMVPVGQIYSKLSRTVRKLARELNKEIELVLRGEDTELDKMMVEELTDPLMHIIRNALDHGIESAEERRAAGKNPVGHVTLNAYQQGNSVVLDVTDDGRGIDPERIRARGRAAADWSARRKSVDQQRAYELMFTPGFSTAAAGERDLRTRRRPGRREEEHPGAEGDDRRHLARRRGDDVPDLAADHAGHHPGADRRSGRREVRHSAHVGRGVAAHLLARHPHRGAEGSLHAARLHAAAAPPLRRLRPRRTTASTAPTRSGSSSSRAPARRPSASSSTRWCASRKWSSSRSASG